MGRYQGVHGLIIDALLSVRLVTATGELITVSADSNPELFWALRGAGMNFGVVTSATYKVADMTNGGQVLSADLIYPGSVNGSFFEALEKLVANQPKELSVLASSSYDVNTGSVSLVPSSPYSPLACHASKC